jgi:hypothetical protein
MLDAPDVECWRFRRDARITLPLASAIRRNPEGIAYLAPEIQSTKRAPRARKIKRTSIASFRMWPAIRARG